MLDNDKKFENMLYAVANLKKFTDSNDELSEEDLFQVSAASSSPRYQDFLKLVESKKSNKHRKV